MFGIKEKDIPSMILQGNEKKAIALLYKKVFPKVKRFIVSRNGIEDDAHDIFQDGLMVFYKQVTEGKFQEKYQVYGYLFRLSINRWINKIKRDKKIDLSDDIMSYENKEFSFEETSFENGRTEKKQELIIQKIFSDLGEKCKQALTYSIFYDLSIEDIQLRLEMASEGAVKMQIKRCKDKLQQKLLEQPHLLKILKGND